MPRLTREQKQAETREKLLAAALSLFARVGYGGASIDRIAEEAGFSKGAIYSNFGSKEDIFFQVLATYSESLLPDVLGALDGAVSAQEAIEILAAWADERSRDVDLPWLVLEHVRHSRQSGTFGERQQQLFRANWLALGEKARTFFPAGKAQIDAEALGALVFEIAFAPAMSFSAGPTAGTLVRLALTGLLSNSASAG